MNNASSIIIIALMMALTACSSSNRPTYSGHEESTEGVPGFVNGKKVSPHVKLGQSYTVNGETYVPRLQPDYVEEGMASWYGPGFHGGKTANGERFDAGDLTAAHRTLPLPSIIRVTMLTTGKQVIVRVNDRGPFAHSRILDMSRGAAEKIGLVRAGVAKVRVEYMKNESERFAELLADGRDPKSIDLESEVINFTGEPAPKVYAQSSVVAVPTPDSYASTWDSITDSNDASVQNNTDVIVTEDDIGVASNESAPVTQVTATTLTSSDSRGTILASTLDRKARASPFAALDNNALPEKPLVSSTSTLPTSPATPASHGAVYVQIGAFQNEANAERLLSKYAGVNGLRVEQKARADGQILFHVRMGPYASSQESNRAFKQLQDAGAEAKIVKD